MCCGMEFIWGTVGATAGLEFQPLQDLVHVTQAAEAGAWRARSRSKQGFGAEGPRGAGHQREEEAVT